VWFTYSGLNHTLAWIRNKTKGRNGIPFQLRWGFFFLFFLFFVHLRALVVSWRPFGRVSSLLLLECRGSKCGVSGILFILLGATLKQIYTGVRFQQKKKKWSRTKEKMLAMICIDLAHCEIIISAGVGFTVHKMCHNRQKQFEKKAYIFLAHIRSAA
jgi:hypothetical protein